MIQSKRSSGRRSVLCTFAVVMALHFLSGCGGPDTKDDTSNAPAQTTPKPQSDEEQAESTVRKWLDELKKGQYDSNDYWLDSSAMRKYPFSRLYLYALQSYDIQSTKSYPVNDLWKEAGAKKVVGVLFRATHSEKDGKVVTHDYRVEVFDTGGVWRLANGHRR